MTIFNQVIRRICASKLKLAIIFLCPVLFAGMFMSTARSVTTILVEDDDKSALSGRLVAGLTELDPGIDVQPAGGGEALDRVMSYQADEALRIPKGFEEAVLAGESPSVEAFYLLELEGVHYVRAYVDGFVSDMKALAGGTGHDRERFGAALASWADGRLSVAGPPEDGSRSLKKSYGSLGFLVQFMLYMSIITAGIVLEDRSSGVFYRTFFSPVTLKRYYMGNMLASLAVGELQAAVSILLLAAVFRMDFVNLPAVLVLFAVFTPVCIALGMWLITFFRKPMFAYLSILFVTTPLVMLGGCYWPMSYLPDTVQKIAMFLPTTWVMQAADKVLNAGAGVPGIGLELMVLLLFAGLFLAAGLVKKVDVAK